MTLIAAGAVALDGRICRPGWLQTSGQWIRDCGAGPPPRRADLDMSDAVVVPGFIDMHVHGGGGASYTDAIPDEIIRAADFHRRHGTTTTLASLVTAAPEQLLAALRALAEATRRGVIAGIHLEGPWLSPGHCGAHDRTQMRDPLPAEIDAVLAAGDGAIQMVTLAPERPGSAEAITRLVDANVVVAVGHTGADYEQTRRAITAGASVGTHLFNAMPPLHHREPGPVLALLQAPAVTVEVIADGVHLHAAVLRHVIDTAGAHRVALITDAIGAAGMSDGPFRLGGQDIDVVCGMARLRGTATIAGSTATMDHLFRMVVHHLGHDRDAALAAAVEMTSATPARTLRLGQVGRLRAGMNADLVVLNRDLQVTAVMRHGVWQEHN